LNYFSGIFFILLDSDSDSEREGEEGEEEGSRVSLVILACSSSAK
jgi:hypothetical protein